MKMKEWMKMTAGTVKRYRVHMIIAAALICNLAAVGGVVAYLTSADAATNTYGIGHVDSDIVEEFDPPPKLVPGVSFEKNVKVKNTGDCPSHVRVQAVFTDGDMEKLCSVDWNTKDYEYRDGYYYYKSILEVGEVTEPLFTTITLDGEATVDQLKNFDILVYVEAYQSIGAETYKDAWSNFRKNCTNNFQKGSTV